MKQTPAILEAIKVSYSMGVNTFSARTVWLLLGHIEAIQQEAKQSKADEALAVAAAGSLYGEAIQLKKELSGARDARDRLIENVAQLKRQLEEAREAKKVSLSREVADAIKRLRSVGFSNYAIIALSDQVSMLGRDYSVSINNDLQTIKSCPLVDRLIEALVHGYTVEQTPDDYVVAQYVSFRIANKHDEADAMMKVITILGKTDLLKRMEQAGGTTRS